MKTGLTPSAWRKGAYVLIVTLLFLAIMLGLLAGVTRVANADTAMTARNNLYNSSIAAAEGGSEIVIAQMNRDFLFGNINADLDVYRTVTPNTVQGSWPMQFQFSDGAGVVDRAGVQSLGPGMSTNMNSRFNGLYGWVLPYRITSSARALNRLYGVSATVSQDIQFAAIPVFQFAIFYSLDLEINPGPSMIITGKVHSNNDIYTAPGAALTYRDSVTAVGRIINDRHPDDPQYGSSKVAPVYSAYSADEPPVGGDSALTLPVGTNNSPDSVREIVEPPPPGEDPNSLQAKQRFYNKSDVIITTTSSGVRVTTGAWDNFRIIPPNITNASGPSYSFVKTNVSFYDYRERKPTTTTEIDVAALNAWLADPASGGAVEGSVQNQTGHGVRAIYVDDRRTNASTLTAVRVVNGQQLPDEGLTVATRLPLYVKGHFNLNNGNTTPALTNTALTKPAALIGDSITVLSGSWNDNNGQQQAYDNRRAENTTVNAAFLGGIVKTTRLSSTSSRYSGGAENFPRFLEDWNGRTLTYNGSMVVMYESKYAKSFWVSPGSGGGVYGAPTRRWAFDLNFLSKDRLPPGCPEVKTLIRDQWRVVSGS